MKKIIKRTDPQYIEVENFNDYALTESVAFEMAIRNDNILSLYTLFNIIWYANGDYAKFYNFTNEAIKDSLDKQFEVEQTLISEYFITPYDTHVLLAVYNFSSLYNPNISLKKIDNKDKNVSPINYKNERIIYTHNIDDVSILSTTTTINETLQEDNNANPFFYADINLLETNELLENVTHSVSIEKKRNQFIIPNHITKKVTLDINLSLPLDEVLSQVKLIHKAFNKSTMQITPIEQLNYKLEKANTQVCYKKPRAKREETDANKYFKFQYKMANMLYIYDAYKIGMKQKEIQHELSYYNGDTTMDTTIINEMHAIAKEYINNLKYKELITGTQQI